jgi:hypothetical protein
VGGIGLHVVAIFLGQDNAVLQDQKGVGVGGIKKVLKGLGSTAPDWIGYLTKIRKLAFQRTGLAIPLVDTRRGKQIRHMLKAVAVMGRLVPVRCGVVVVGHGCLPFILCCCAALKASLSKLSSQGPLFSFKTAGRMMIGN